LTIADVGSPSSKKALETLTKGKVEKLQRTNLFKSQQFAHETSGQLEKSHLKSTPSEKGRKITKKTKNVFTF
jgi:hypothetical protein